MPDRRLPKALLEMRALSARAAALNKPVPVTTAPSDSRSEIGREDNYYHQPHSGAADVEQLTRATVPVDDHEVKPMEEDFMEVPPNEQEQRREKSLNRGGRTSDELEHVHERGPSILGSEDEVQFLDQQIFRPEVHIPAFPPHQTRSSFVLGEDDSGYRLGLQSDLQSDNERLKRELEARDFTILSIQRNLENLSILSRSEHAELGATKKLLARERQQNTELREELRKVKETNLVLQQKVVALRAAEAGEKVAPVVAASAGGGVVLCSGAGGRGWD